MLHNAVFKRVEAASVIYLVSATLVKAGSVSYCVSFTVLVNLLYANEPW